MSQPWTKRVICATDLAKFVVCEQKALFDHRHGEQLSPQAARRIDEGNRAHARHLEQAFAANPVVRSSEPKPWCFLATCVYGGAGAETGALRALRDQVLRRSFVGRALIRLYYRVSPRIACCFNRRACAKAITRLLLFPIVVFAMWRARRRSCP